MTETAGKLICEEFQYQLPDLIGTGEDIYAHPHLQTCELCRALVDDLMTIATAARLLFPVEEPPDALWENIEIALKEEEKASAERSKKKEKEKVTVERSKK
jgi:predicted anti-sigma-YlaC factor YlaD